jgi:hypothetical protein
MPNVLIRDVPAEAHAVLSSRAAASGMSLQKFLVHELVRIASTATMTEVISEIDATKLPRLSADEVVEIVNQGRLNN